MKDKRECGRGGISCEVSEKLVVELERDKIIVFCAINGIYLYVNFLFGCHMKRLFVSILMFILAVSFQSCTESKAVDDVLQEAEACMEEHPEHSLEMLEAIRQEAMTGKRQKARYALLLSMAYDKNYIDLQSDSVIAPAVEYYRKHGTADEKLKTGYYRSRISMNVGDYEQAMTYLVEAERYGARCSDKIAVGRLYNGKKHVFQYMHAARDMASAAEASAKNYLEGGDTLRYLNALSDALSAYLQVEDTLMAAAYLKKLQDNQDFMTQKQKSRYYSGLLYLNQYTHESPVHEILDRYYSDMDSALDILWISVADALCAAEEYPQALEALKNHTGYGGEMTSAYWHIYGIANDRLGNMGEAVEAYRRYILANDRKNGYIFESDTRFVEERYEWKGDVEKRNYILAILGLAAGVIMLASMMIVGRIKRMRRERLLEEEKHRQELQHYNRLYDEAQNEIERLKKARRNAKIGESVRSLVDERLNVLNRFVAANISGSFTKAASEELNSLMSDRSYFLESTRMSFVIAHPEFLSFLKKSGLTDTEISYCCMYCIGLNGNEIAGYLQKPSMYNASVTLRRKLSIDRSMNIDRFLFEKMQSLDKKV